MPAEEKELKPWEEEEIKYQKELENKISAEDYFEGRKVETKKVEGRRPEKIKASNLQNF